MIDIAIDTGGTFTDYSSVGSLNNQKEDKIFIKNPTDGIIEGLNELASSWGTDLETLLANTNQISHGTTLA